MRISDAAKGKLMEAIQKIMKMMKIGEEKRATIGRLSRQRVLDNYSLSHIAEQYESLYLTGDI